MPTPLDPVPGPEAPFTGIIKTRKRKRVDESVPFPAGLTVLQDFEFKKKDTATYEKERAAFDSICDKWLKGLAKDEATVKGLLAAGLTPADIEAMKKGNRPDGYQVHHKLALDDGGTNDTTNFVLIQNDPYHMAITGLHKTECHDLKPGESTTLDWPMPDGIIYPPAPPAPPA